MTEISAPSGRKASYAFVGGALIGCVGGLIGLGGAEFRLPLLIAVFGFAGLEAVILNKATSLVVVAAALPFRSSVVSLADITGSWPVVLNLLAGSLVGAWTGAGWATRLSTPTLYRVIAVLLVGVALTLVLGHGTDGREPALTGVALLVAGVAAGFAIGVVASLLGVAGGEFLIPTLVLLYGADIKLAGSLSLVVSLPTMLVGFARYSSDRSFAALSTNRGFVMVMAAGSILGAFIGAQLLGLVSNEVLLPVLAIILLVSAVKIWRH